MKGALPTTTKRRFKMLYDDENNVVDAVVYCESNGVEVSKEVETSSIVTSTASSSDSAIRPAPLKKCSPKGLLSCWKPAPGLEMASSTLPSPDSTRFLSARNEPIVQWSSPPPTDLSTNGSRHSTPKKKDEEQSLFDETTVLSDDDCFDSDPFAPRTGKSLLWKHVDMVVVSVIISVKARSHRFLLSRNQRKAVEKR